MVVDLLSRQKKTHEFFLDLVNIKVCSASEVTYFLVQRGFQKNRLIRHHKALAELSFLSRSCVIRSKLDFANDKTTGVPVEGEDRKKLLVKFSELSVF